MGKAAAFPRLQIAVAEEEKSRKQSASSRFLVLLSLSLFFLISCASRNS